LSHDCKVGEHVSRNLVQDVLRFKSRIQCSQTMEEGFKAQDQGQGLRSVQNGIDSHIPQWQTEG